MSCFLLPLHHIDHPPTCGECFSANTISSAAKESNLLFNIEWPLAQQKAFVLLPLDHFTHTHNKKTHQRRRKRKSQLSPVATLPFFCQPPLASARIRVDWIATCHAVAPMGHHGSKPKVKGGTLGTAAGSAGRCRAHLPTSIIENPPTVAAQTPTPLSLFLNFFLSEQQNNTE